jgi:hypothetical protein
MSNGLMFVDRVLDRAERKDRKAKGLPIWKISVH